MELSNERQFPFSMETAWAALHKPAMLDVEPGAEVHEVSAERWEARNKEAGTVTVYTASYDEEGKTLTIEGESTAKSDHDFLYLTLKEDGAKSVTLEIKIEIHTGAHLIARALGAVFAKPMQEIMCRHIYHNFEALCTGKETKRMSKAELDGLAKTIFEKK